MLYRESYLITDSKYFTRVYSKNLNSNIIIIIIIISKIKEETTKAHWLLSFSHNHVAKWLHISHYTVKPPSIIPERTVFTQVSLISSAPEKSPIWMIHDYVLWTITFPCQSVSHISWSDSRHSHDDHFREKM